MTTPPRETEPCNAPAWSAGWGGTAPKSSRTALASQCMDVSRFPDWWVDRRARLTIAPNHAFRAGDTLSINGRPVLVDRVQGNTLTLAHHP